MRAATALLLALAFGAMRSEALDPATDAIAARDGAGGIDIPAPDLAPPAPADSAAAAPRADSAHAVDTLSDAWADRVDSLRMAEDTAAAAGPVPEEGPAAESPPLPGTAPGRGSLAGRVVSEMSGTVIAKARIILVGREKSAETDADGNFGFADLEPGLYALLVTHPSYAPLTAESLAVAAGKGALRRLRLPDKAVQGEKVRITGKAGKASDAGLLFAQKNAPGVSDGISAEQVSKSPDGDAAAAVKRVSGISIAGDGLVYVRGLGERYVNVQLNGLSLSSPNFEKRVIPLDLFPTRLLENLVVTKSFTADQPAEFGGGALQIRTKDIPDGRVLEVSATAGYGPGSTFGSMLTYDGGSLDWLGVEDGSRDYPDGIPEETFDHRNEALGATAAERKARQEEILASLPNIWTPHSMRAPLNQGYGLTMGNRIPLGDDRVAGWLFSSSYSGKWSFDEEFVGRVGLDNDKQPFLSDRTTSELSTQSVLWGILGTASYLHSPDHKYRLNVLANREWEDEVTRVYGLRELDPDTTLLYILSNSRQTLLNGQLEGEHRFDPWESETPYKLNWMLALSGSSRHEPDRRFSKYFVDDPADTAYNPDFPYVVAATGGLQDRYWYDLEEGGMGAKLDLDIPVPLGEDWFRESRLTLGAFGFDKGRTYEVKRLTYVSSARLYNSEARHGPYEDFMGAFDGTSDTGYITNRTLNPKDEYEVDDRQWAVHGQVDLDWQWPIRTIAGLRLNGARVAGVSHSTFGTLTPAEKAAAECPDGEDLCEVPFGYDIVRLLPALSLVFPVTAAQNLRASYARTYSFPEYREMSPMKYVSYLEALETVGNIDLKPTEIHNYDLRWEFFPTPGDLVALSGFYKRFTDPVETRISQISSNNEGQFVNAPSAYLAGAEAEARSRLGGLHPALSPFQVVANFTLIHSEVDGERKRTIQGQSPYLVNLMLFYEAFKGSLQMSLLYNRVGERLTKVGVDDLPDVFEDARESLEYAYSQRLSRHLKLKFTARNLTDAEFITRQGGLVVRRTVPGPNFTLGITYAL